MANYEYILKRMQKKIENYDYELSTHILIEKMPELNLAKYDIEYAILSGVIKYHQIDKDTGETKYIIEGLSASGDEITTVAKFSFTGKLIIITVYRT